MGGRLTPIEVGLPDRIGRLKLLQTMSADVTLAEDVHLREIASLTDMAGRGWRDIVSDRFPPLEVASGCAGAF